MEAETGKYFHINDKWVEIDKRKNLSEPDIKTEEPKLTNNGKDLFEHCVEYWDKVKSKYRYSHLMRKRVLTMKHNDWRAIEGDKEKIENLLESDGKVKGMYVDKSNLLEVRGEGVKSLFNGKLNKSKISQVKVIPLSSLKESQDSETEQPEDILNDIKKCLGIEDLNLEDVFDQVEEMSESEINNNYVPSGKKHECSHFIERQHKKLFTVPECQDSSTTSDEPVSLTQFEKCFHELHRLEKEPDVEDKQSVEKVKSDENVWNQLKKCQFEKYGYTDSDFYTFSESEETKDNFKFNQEEDFLKKILENLMERKILYKGTLITIKKILGDKTVKDVFSNIKEASVTLRDSKGNFLKGLDLRREPIIDREGFFMKNILEKLVGEWTTMGVFLKQLAINSQDPFGREINAQTSAVPAQTINRIGLKIQQILQDIIDEDDKNKDVTFEIKYESSNNANSFASDESHTVDQKETTKLNYREKNIAHKNNQLLATKKDMEITTEAKSPNKTDHEKISLDVSDYNCPCLDSLNKHVEDENERTDKEIINHRGIVELMSGAMYAGSWNYLGMNGCALYMSPGGTIIEGHMSDSVFDGPATVYLPNGIIISCAFDKGVFHQHKITFGDGVEYKTKEWQYLNRHDKSRKKKQTDEPTKTSSIFNRKIPEGCYDTGEGFYNPKTKVIYHPTTMVPIRSVSQREEKWILSICKAENPNCVSFDEHLYEVFDIGSKVNEVKTELFDDSKVVWNGCKLALKQKPQSLPRNISPDGLIQTNEQSRPIEDLCKSIMSVTGNLKAQIAVPFSFERVLLYTCFDEHNQNKPLRSVDNSDNK